MLNDDEELARTQRENEMLAAENERLLRELREASEKYAEMRGSLSWKITAPLRKALDLLVKPSKDLSGPIVLSDENYRLWVERFDTLNDADRSAIRAATKGLKYRPLFSLLLVVHDSPADAIQQTIQSIRRQIYREWEICLVDDASTAPHVARALASCGDDPRVRVARRLSHAEMEAQEEAAGMSRGSFFALLEPGDMLAESALFEIAAAIQAEPKPDIIYSDEDAMDAQGKRCSPRFKTDWNPALLREQNYFGQLRFQAREASFERRVCHVPSILCHRQLGITCTRAGSRLPTGSQDTILPHSPKVSVIIPTRDRADLLERCIEGLFNRTDYPAMEVIVVDNDSREEKTKLVFAKYPVRVLSFPGEFNWSAMNNAGAREATGDILLFLNNDIDVIEKSWLRELAERAWREDTGAVGAKLLFADGTVQHAGIWLGPGGRMRHLLRLSNRDDEGYLGQLSLLRNLSAVTGACLATRRKVFLELEGFDESFPVSYNDLDFCLRLRQKGYQVVWTPHAELFHLESASRGSSEWRWRKEEADHKRFCAKWQQEMENDPFFNPNLDLIGEETLALACPPRVKKPWKR
jgi:O-antigen biosynthesis protein